MTYQTLYAYLNINNPMVAWEVAIGRIRSACDLGMENDNFGISLWQYNLLRKYATSGPNKRFKNELLLESCRQKNSPESVSRLRGVYFFENERDAHAAVERWGVSGNRKYITPVHFSSTKTTRVDSEWITSFLRSDEMDWMKKYWSGAPLGQQPLTEVLASGVGVVQNIELRKEAYMRVMEESPEATSLLAMATCGFQYSKIDSIAQTIPGIIREKDGVRVSLYIYIGDLENREQELAEAIATCKERNEMPPIIMPADPNALFRVPDNTSQEFLLTDPDISIICSEIHSSIRSH